MRRPLLLVVVALALTAPASAQSAALDRANRDLQGLWDREVLPVLLQRVADEARGFAGTTRSSGRTSVEVYSVTPTLELRPALGIRRLDDRGVHLRLPGQGTWRIVVEADLRARGKLGFIRWSKRLRLRGEVNDLWADMRFDLDPSNPDLPVVSNSHRPRVSFSVKAKTDTWYLNLILGLFRKKLDRLAHRAVADAIAQLDPQLRQLVGQPNLYGVGGPGIAAHQGPALPLQEAAEKIHQSIVRDHLPYGSLGSVVWDRPYHGTWEDSLVDPAFDPGNKTGHYGGLGDSAIWSGHYLASIAFRWAVTHEQPLLRDAEAMIDNFHTMLRLRGPVGLLNRAMLPLAAQPGAAGWSGVYVTTYQGVDYVNWDFISRDQYMGLLLGLTAIHDLVPPLRRKAGAELQTALDYMLANHWTARRHDGSVSTTWALNFPQQLAWLTAGDRAAPGKYAAALAEYHPVADLAWTAQWASVTDPVNKYYKFNLAHGVLATYLRQEGDPGRFHAVMRSLRLLRAAIGHHQNAHFDMCYASADAAYAGRSASRADFEALMTLWLKRPRRYVRVENSADPTIDQAAYAPPGVVTVGAPTTNRTIVIAKHPLPVDRRRCTDFLWQRDPFTLDGHGNGTENEPGVDFTLPYWMARYYGVAP